MTAAEIPQGGPRRRTRADRLLAAFPTLVLALTIFTMYAIEAWSRKTPWIFGDELEWTQISRAIASTGHAARRGQPIFFKSIYAYLIAPVWWIHSTATAYAALKYLNGILMPLAAIPTYLLARMLVPRRTAVVVAALAVLIPGMAYATSIIPEVLFYPYYSLCSWLAVRAFRSGGKRDGVIAAVAVLGGFFVKEAEATSLSCAFALAAIGLWLTGPRGRALRRGWTRGDTAGAIVLTAGALFLFNRVVLQNVHEWQLSTQWYKGRMLDLGLQAVLSLSIGLGLLPVIGGLVSLRLAERKGDPTYRAFAAWTGAAIFSVSMYAAVKAAYLSTIFGTYVEERNMIYLSPLLLIGTAMVLGSKHLDWRIVTAAAAFVAYIVLAKPFQLGPGYFEAPGFSIPAALNFYDHWTQNESRVGLVIVLGFGLLALAWRRRRAVRLGTLALLACWLVAGEISMTVGLDNGANYAALFLQKQPNWVDLADHGEPITYLGQSITPATPLWETEFWNRSMVNVDSLDGTAPGPGPTSLPTLLDSTGLLADDPGTPYALTDSGIRLAAPVVKREGTMTIYRLDGPWHLVDNTEGVYSDTWCSHFCAYTYFEPNQKGTLTVTIGRLGYGGAAPPSRATLQVGTVRIDNTQEPVIKTVTRVIRRLVENGTSQTIEIPIARTPVRVELTVPKTFRAGPNDPRQLSAQVSFAFKPSR